MDQKNAFISFEADAWFERNKKALENYLPEEDNVIKVLKSYNIDCQNVLEIGSSSGYRLNAIQDIFGSKTVTGVEPSSQAIEYGKKAYPNVEFIQTTAEDISAISDSSMDVVIMGFVFYVIDRELVLKTMSEIDRVLKNKGTLVLIDFFSETTLKNKYHHIDSFNAYSFKQNYDEVFTATRLYHLLDRSSFSHSSQKSDAKEDFTNLYSVSLLKKDIHASYK